MLRTYVNLSSRAWLRRAQSLVLSNPTSDSREPRAKVPGVGIIGSGSLDMSVTTSTIQKALISLGVDKAWITRLSPFLGKTS